MKMLIRGPRDQCLIPSFVEIKNLHSSSSPPKASSTVLILFTLDDFGLKGLSGSASLA